MPYLLICLGAGGLFSSVLLSPEEEAQTITAPPIETALKRVGRPPIPREDDKGSPLPYQEATASRPWCAGLDEKGLQVPHPDLLEPQTRGQEVEDYPFAFSIEEASCRHGVEPELIRAIIMAESRFDPRAVSKKGAKGLMQLMPATAKALGVKDIFDPHVNIAGGVKYLRILLDRFQGDVTLALAAYHAGGKRVQRHRGVPPIGATRYYVKQVSRYYELYKKESKG